MFEFIAIIFPTLVALLLIKLFPYTLDEFFARQEQKTLKQHTIPMMKEDEKAHNNFYTLVILGVCLFLGRH